MNFLELNSPALDISSPPAELKVFPNPAKNQLFVQLPKVATNTLQTISLTDLTGKVLQTSCFI